jgi:hypothetical protein
MMKKERNRKPEELYEIIEDAPMFCLNCGAQWPEEAKVCLQCGGSVSTPGVITNLPKNAKRSRKGAIASTILGACAFVLVAFAVLTQVLKDRSQEPAGVGGAPVVYSGRLPTPTPTPIPTPFWKSENYEIDTKAMGLQPGQMWSRPLNVQSDWRNARLVGKFTAEGGDTIEAAVTNEADLVKWQKNYSYRPKALYNSGRVTEAAINAPLPAGQSYFILDNRFPGAINKTIRFNLRVEYERLAQP